MNEAVKLVTQFPDFGSFLSLLVATSLNPLCVQCFIVFSKLGFKIEGNNLIEDNIMFTIIDYIGSVIFPPVDVVA
jgi:hypothetical protein